MKKVCDRASDKKLELMSQAAVMAALTAALTLWLHIPAGLNGGYIHFGDAVIYLAAALLPKPYAMAAGAAGGVIADLLTAPLWAPATLLIKPLLVLPFLNGGERIVTRRNTAALVLAIFSVGIRVLSGRRTDVWFSHGVSCHLSRAAQYSPAEARWHSWQQEAHWIVCR